MFCCAFWNFGHFDGVEKLEKSVGNAVVVDVLALFRGDVFALFHTDVLALFHTEVLSSVY